MPLTLEEIAQREEGLRQEIAERERLLSAYQLIRADRAKPSDAASGPPARPTPASIQTEEAPAPPPAPVNLPAPPPWKINPVLAALRRGFGSTGRAVAWAIQQMTEDYTLNDIQALLEREGWPMRSAEISVVLTRLKGRGKIEEIKPGGGRRASVFRKPESATPQQTETSEPNDGTDSITRADPVA